MSNTIGRRQLLAGLSAAAVIAFDPFARSWVTEARAHGSPHGISIPHLDGQLTIDPAALAEAADDFGHIIHRAPVAVLQNGTKSDVRSVIKFANRHGLEVAMRGQGHSTYGQAQAQGGIVIDSRSAALSTIGPISGGAVVVGPGTRWVDLLTTTLSVGLTPPVLTDYIELSVGGTLSVGGIGGATQRHGLQVDNVLELEVVTGEGKAFTCSPSHRPDLFNAVLGGLGQFGVIVGAKIPLIAAPTNVRIYNIYFDSLSDYLTAQRVAVSDGRFDYLEGQVVAADGGGWRFMVEAGAYYGPASPPNDAALLAGIRAGSVSTVIDEHSYFDWANRVAALKAVLVEAGAWDLPHPWFDVFLPDDEVEPFVSSVLASLTLADTGGGPILLYPFKTAKLTRPFVAKPESSVAFLFDILRFAPPVQAVVDAMVAANRAMFEQARALGGKKYPVGSIPFGPGDWVQHFGDEYPRLILDKAQFDPRRVLAPGQGIF